MAGLMQSMAGLGDITDKVIATDLMNSAKSGIKNYASALSETATTEARAILQAQLIDAIKAHESISNYMMRKGYYDAYNLSEQIQSDIKDANSVLNI